MAAAISVAWVSSAKCPVSKKRTVAFGMSRLNASAPGGRKNGSFLPHTASRGGLCVAEILLEGRIERDIALVVAEQVELHVGRRRAGRGRNCRANSRPATRSSGRARRAYIARRSSPA